VDLQHQRLVKAGAKLIDTGSERNRYAVEEIYRTYTKVEREITFLDNQVVHVRDPPKEAVAQAIAFSWAGDAG